MDSVTAPADGAAGPSAASSSTPILVGRTREQVSLREELAAAIGGRGRLVLVGGEAGIGKTTLARDLTGEAGACGARVLAGSCYDLTNTPPYGPWLDLFDGCLDDPSLPSPPTAFAGGQVARVTDQSALYSDVRQFFAALTVAGPALVVLEDLHWADPASVDLLRHVGLHLRHWPILLLATYRGDELTRHHPFFQLLPALVRESDGRRLDLRRLDEDAHHALVASRYRLSVPDEGRLVAYLERHAEGNPFFATELLRTLEEEALLRRDEDAWTLAELDRVIVPSLLRQVIEERVAHHGAEMRQPLSVAAVIGQEVPLALWAKVAQLDDEALFDVVERAVEAHLLEAARDGTRVHFVHALTREALYEGVLPPRRRIMHWRVAEALLASVDPDPDAVAYHLQEAGDPRAWEWLVRAGERAQRAYAWLTAIERFRAAQDLLAHVDGDARTRGRLLHRVAFLARFSDPARAIAAAAEAGRLAVQAGDAVLAAEARHARGTLLMYADRANDGFAEVAEGISALEAMSLDTATSLAVIRAWFVSSFVGTAAHPTADDEHAAARLQAAGLYWLRGMTVWVGALIGHPREAVAAGERFLAVLALGPDATEGTRFIAAFAHHGGGIAYAALGRPDDARRAVANARATFRDLGHHVLVAFSLCFELWDVVYPFGPTDPAVRRTYAAEAEAALARAVGALAPGVSPRLACLSCLVLDGRWDEVLGILQDLPTPGNACLRREVSGPHATLARHRGDLATAWERIRPLFPNGPATEPGDLIHQEGLFMQRLAAALCLDAMDVDHARAWLEAHDRWLDWSESVLGRADGRLAWARYYQAIGDAARARDAASEALLSDPEQPLVGLAAHRLLGEIESAAGNHAAADAHLTAALDLAAACEMPFERALTLLALAESRAATRAVDEAAVLLEESRQICTTLGAAPTLARADALAARLGAKVSTEPAPAGLTRRELEVLRLLVLRLSDKEIAEALYLGPRTVQSHVAHIFNKLGVANRRDAADEARRRGLV